MWLKQYGSSAKLTGFKDNNYIPVDLNDMAQHATKQSYSNRIRQQ